MEDQITRVEGRCHAMMGKYEFHRGDPPPEGNPFKAATLFISKDSTPPKVFTEEQVKAMLNAIVKNYEFYGDMRFLEHVATKHGITL